MKEKASVYKRIADTLCGGLPMRWPTVILFAVGAAALTAVFLTVPFFKDSSFERMGVYLEAWIFFAILIMTNCRKPLEAAAKTFVFFLISQPLIYLLQVPFSVQGWGLFRYYRYWFFLTLLTFPAAYIGWFLTKKNWLSVLILSPILIYLGFTAGQSALSCFRSFPHLLLTGLFCLLQISLYVAAFFPGAKKFVGVALAVLAAVFVFLTSRSVAVDTTMFLPDDPVLSENAELVLEEGSDAEVTIERYGEDSMVRIHARRLGTLAFHIQDGEQTYSYTAEIFVDGTGHTQVQITAS